MPKDIITDITNPGICWFKTIFLKIKNDYFEFIKLFYFDIKIHFLDHTSTDDPIIIFILYYTLEIIEQIVLVTNLNFC